MKQKMAKLLAKMQRKKSKMLKLLTKQMVKPLEKPKRGK
jgi:hypothetical protein